MPLFLPPTYVYPTLPIYHVFNINNNLLLKNQVDISTGKGHCKSDRSCMHFKLQFHNIITEFLTLYKMLNQYIINYSQSTVSTGSINLLHTFSHEVNSI